MLVIGFGAFVAHNFLLSAAARTLSLSAVARMSDQEAEATFARIRWSDNGGEPYCPRCGCLDARKLATRPVWKCKGCSHQFSVTAGTIFADRKRPIRDYLLAIAIFANGAKGYSALQLSRDLGCQYKTAFVLAHKLRVAIEADQQTSSFTDASEKEIDGAYFGGHVKPENIAMDRVDRRFAEEQTGKRQVVVVMRERKGRTLPFVFRKESDAIPAIRERVTTQRYARDPQIRDAVLLRAGGTCEFCGKAGFLRQDGSRYLEAHHIIALADDGADRMTNVIALCPNDHRKAHFGRDRAELERRMVQIVESLARPRSSANHAERFLSVTARSP